MEYIDWDSYAAHLLESKTTAQDNTKSVVEEYPDHEKLGKLVITKRGDIKDVLERNGIDPDEIAALIKGEHQEIGSLLHKSLDVDRMDYLARDAHNTGVPYGRIDINYILNNMDMDDDGIVLNAKARIAAEHLLVARYFMFNTVYCHKTVFGFEELVRRIILKLLDRGEIYQSGREIERLATADSEEFLHFHDGYLDKLIDKHAFKSDDAALKTYCGAVRLRRPPKLVHEESNLKSRTSHLPGEYVLFRKCMREQLSDIATKCKVDSWRLIWRETKDVRFEAIEPFVSLSGAHDAKAEEIRQLVRIKESPGEITNLVENPNSIISHLSPLTLKVIRLYGVGLSPTQLASLQREIKQRISP